MEIFNKQKIAKYIKGVTKMATLRQSLITFSGTFINGILGAVFYILSARYLGPTSFGVMMLAITTLTLVSDISEMGTGTGLVRFISKYNKEDKLRALKFLKLSFEIKISIATIILVLGWFLSPIIAKSLFLKPEIASSLRIAFMGVASTLLFTFVTSSLQAFQKFWSWSFIQITANSIRLLFLLGILFIGGLSLNNNLILYIIAPFIGFIIGIYIIKTEFLKVKGENSVLKELFHYNKWIAAFSLVAALGARVDTFISGRLLNGFELGIYTASNQLVQIIPQLVVAINTVVAPKMASMGGIKDLIIYLKKTQVMVLGIAIIGIIFIPIFVYLIPLFYGKSYTASIPVFIVLLLAMLIFLISVPIHMSIFYYFSYPKLFFWLSITQLITVSVFSWSLIPMYGPMGGAVSVLIGNFVSFIIPTIWAVKKIRASI